MARSDIAAVSVSIALRGLRVVEVVEERTQHAHLTGVARGDRRFGAVVVGNLLVVELHVGPARIVEDAPDAVGVGQAEHSGDVLGDRRELPTERERRARHRHPLVARVRLPGDDREPAAGHGGAGEVGERGHGIAEEHHAEAADDHVEEGVGEGVDLRVGLFEGHVGEPVGRRALARPGEHRPGEVDAEGVAVDGEHALRHAVVSPVPHPTSSTWSVGAIAAAASMRSVCPASASFWNASREPRRRPTVRPTRRPARR